MNDLNDKKTMTDKKAGAMKNNVVKSPEKTPSSSDYKCLCPCKESLNDVINGNTEKTVKEAVHLYSEVTAKSQKKVIEDLSTAQASENVISKVQTKMHTDAFERNLRKLNLCVLKVPESNKATSKQRQEDDAKFCLETLKIEKKDFISCHRAG
ncbi:hypothetical protein ACHWQZ_G002870 [Mnemiopsis leidyi]